MDAEEIAGYLADQLASDRGLEAFRVLPGEPLEDMRSGGWFFDLEVGDRVFTVLVTEDP